MKHHRAPQSKGSVVDRMRLQLAMKRTREEARRLGMTPEAYLAQCQAHTLDETSETLAKRIVDKALKTPESSPPPSSSGGGTDLKDLVEQILKKGKS